MSAKKQSKDPEVRLFAEHARKWTDKKLYDEFHKAPDLKVVESVVRDMHEDILSVLAPHFDDDVMEDITKILGEWYGFKTDIEYVDPSRDQFKDFNDTDDRTVSAGDVFRHFKGNYYQVVAVGLHTETKETMVIYRATHNLGTAKIFVRPMESFLSEVDHEKYPEYTQKWRLQKVKPGEQK